MEKITLEHIEFYTKNSGKAPFTLSEIFDFRRYLKDTGRYYILIEVEDAWFDTVVDSATDFLMYIPWLNDELHKLDPDLMVAVKEAIVDWVNDNMTVLEALKWRAEQNGIDFVHKRLIPKKEFLFGLDEDF